MKYLFLFLFILCISCKPEPKAKSEPKGKYDFDYDKFSCLSPELIDFVFDQTKIYGVGLPSYPGNDTIWTRYHLTFFEQDSIKYLNMRPNTYIFNSIPSPNPTYYAFEVRLKLPVYIYIEDHPGGDSYLYKKCPEYLIDSIIIDSVFRPIMEYDVIDDRQHETFRYYKDSLGKTVFEKQDKRIYLYSIEELFNAMQ